MFFAQILMGMLAMLIFILAVAVVTHVISEFVSGELSLFWTYVVGTLITAGLLLACYYLGRLILPA